MGQFLTKTFGRRISRQLSATKKQLLNNFLPSFTIDPSLPDFCETFLSSNFKEIWLEVGFGNGEHLIEQARRNPEAILIGSEVYVNGVADTLWNMRQKNVENIRFFNDDVRLLMTHLPKEFLTKVFILFPDPWPKGKHHKRRLLTEDTLRKIHSLLKNFGSLYVASDDLEYMAFCQKELTQLENFKIENRWSDGDRPSRITWPETKYERRACAKGLLPIYLEVKKYS